MAKPELNGSENVIISHKVFGQKVPGRAAASASHLVSLVVLGLAVGRAGGRAGIESGRNARSPHALS